MRTRPGHGRTAQAGDGEKSSGPEELQTENRLAKLPQML
jgi:hypothetical protein